MVTLIGIEGAAGNANNPATGYAGSFIHKLTTHWPDKGWSRYVPGPQGATGGISVSAAIACTHAVAMQQQPGACGLILAGYSRGAAAAIVAAHMLNQQGIAVDCLAMFDGVDRDPSAGTTVIPNNVAMTVHGMRSWSSGSRRTWGNCGWIVPNQSYQFTLKMTHWGASGVPLSQGLPLGVKPWQLVTENHLVTGQPKATNVTWQEDLTATAVLWAIMNAHINAAYLKCKQGCVAPPVGTPSTGNPPAAGGATYTVVAGESLSLITGNFWGDVLLWPLLYDANVQTIGSNPNLIKPGQRLAVPDIKSYSQSQLDAARSRGRNWQAA